VSAVVVAPYRDHLAQLDLLLRGWGMPPDYAARTAEVMAWADLHGIDSHGISMVPAYHVRVRDGRLRMAARPSVLRETPVSALIDGDYGLGHEPARQAMEIAIRKAQTTGVGVVSVRHSAHFGACGFYVRMATDAGLVGMVATSAVTPQVAPAGSAAPRLGTDPWAFGAPGQEGQPFVLDMATTTVAAGKIRNKANENLPAPPGWLLDKAGQPSTDPREASQKGGSLTWLGGSPEGSNHKGYGLAVMVNILGACLSGATLITDPKRARQPAHDDVGHFFLALDPGLFRTAEEFRADVAGLCNVLRATPPLDPARPVMVAGDPERAAAARRMQDGIPTGRNLLAEVRTIAEESGVPWLLAGDPVAGTAG
jgi:LDH2 family malate/lactate/ureidoglycolate dehydrogenase